VISIEGMTCSSCSSAVFKALDGVEGIDTVSVDVLGNKATLKHSSALPPAAICEMIEDIGYGAAVASSESASESPTMQRRVKVIVHGIYCQHCITKLNSHLDSLDLIFTPFSTANHTTDITYTPRAPYTIRDILAGLSNVSPEFDAAVVRETSLGDRSRDIQKREVRILLVHWMVAFILTIPTFIM
jgi:copper chaperone CopZ